MLDLSPTLDIQLELLLQDCEEMPCENAYHGDRPHNHDGPARWYVQIVHSCPKSRGGTLVLAYCDKYVQYILRSQDWDAHCSSCGETMTIREYFKVLGRIDEQRQ